MHIRSSKTSLTCAVGFVLITSLPIQAWAGAAYIYEFGSPTDVGTAGAGFAVKAQNASTVFGNPAGMTRFDQPELLAAGVGMYLKLPFQPDGKTTVDGSDGQSSEFSGTGSFGYIHPITPSLSVGVSAQNYFGLALDWSSKWVGRYEVVDETLIAPQVQPTVAWKVNDWLSVGGGAALTLGYLADKKRVFNADPARGDGKLRYSDTDFAVQGNFGIMIEPNERTRFGLRYLTETELNFKDGLHLSNVGPIVGQAKGEALELQIRMPQAVNFSAFHQLNDQWALLGDIGWEEWSCFGQINVQVDPSGNTSKLDLNMRDVWHFGVGAQYQYTPQWLLTAGVSYDTSMSTDKTRPVQLPLGTMYRYGVGFEYEKRKELTIGAGLDFMWEGNLPVAPAGNALAGEVSGKYENVYFVFASVYGKWTF
ncbi:MAG: outer membrane protein transport protein [Pseudomonadota bacterium]|nr:outer membrane protein transport protein [Pseudomonadota bacterium]